MFLAVALVFTSLPMLATAVAAEEAAPAAMAKGDKIVIPNTADNWTGIAAYDDSFASTWIRGGGEQSVLINLYKPGATDNIAKAGTKYTAKIALRTADATFEATKVPPPPSSDKTVVSTPGTVYYMIHYRGYGSDYLAGAWKSINAATLTATPSEYTINFTVPSDTDKTWGLRLVDSRGSNLAYSPVGISGVIIYEYADPSKVAYSWGTYSVDSANKDWSLLNVKQTQEYHENVYLGADVVANTSATYDAEDVTLLPGVYQFTGKFATDAGNVSLSAKVNDTAMNIGATTATEATVDTNATTLTYTLTLDAETTLSTLGLAWNATGANKLKLSDLEFKCVEVIGAAAPNASIKRGTAIASNTSVAFWNSEDGNVNFNEDKWINYPTFGRGYISVNFDAQYTGADQATATYKAYVTMKHNGEDSDTVIVKYRHGPSGMERYFYPTTEWAEYEINTGGLWNAAGGKPWGSEASNNSFFMYPVVAANSSAAAAPTDIDFRGIKVVKNPGTANETVVYATGIYAENDFSNLTYSGNPAATLVDLSALVLTPDADGSVFAYDASSKDIALAPGKYVVSGNFAAASGEQTVKLGAYTADGAVGVIGDEFTVGTDYTAVTVEIDVEAATTLSDISVILGADVAVNVQNLSIMKKGADFNMPNVGILMALLLRLKNEPKFEYTNLIPYIYEDVGSDYWSIPGSASISLKEQDGIEYIAFENVSKNYDLFSYVSGDYLEPGTYKLTGIIRTTVAGQTSQNRVWLGDTRLGSIKTNNNWAAFDYTVTLTEETELVLKFNGDAAEVFNKDFAVARLVLINLNEDPNYVAPDPEDEPVKPEVKVEYIDNGNEKVELKSVEGSLASEIFNDVGTDKWGIFDQDLTVKSQGGNLYLAMRDITVNHQGFTYNSGVTLEPGTYNISCQMRTAVKGQTSMVRVQVNGTVVKLDWINNDWATFAGEFTVGAAEELSIKFFGGPDGSFIKEYDVTDIMVVKVD